MKKISCIVLNYNTASMTQKVIETFKEASKNIPYEVIMIDNASNEPAPFSEDSSVCRIMNSENLGFAKAVNQGIKIAGGDYILLLNSDVFINTTTLESLISYFEVDSSIGIIGPLMVFPDGKFQPSAGYMPTWKGELYRFSTLGKYLPGGTLLYKNNLTEPELKEPVPVEWVSGGCVLIKKEVIEKVGLFDENYFFCIEDFDYCYRAGRAGYKIIYLPTVSVIHHHGFSSGGHGSVFSLKFEKKGMSYFLSKYKKNLLFQLFVTCLYTLKIFYLSNFRKK